MILVWFGLGWGKLVWFGLLVAIAVRNFRQIYWSITSFFLALLSLFLLLVLLLSLFRRKHIIIHINKAILGATSYGLTFFGFRRTGLLGDLTGDCCGPYNVPSL